MKRYRVSTGNSFPLNSLKWLLSSADKGCVTMLLKMQNTIADFGKVWHPFVKYISNTQASIIFLGIQP